MIYKLGDQVLYNGLALTVSRVYENDLEHVDVELKDRPDLQHYIAIPVWDLKPLVPEPGWELHAKANPPEGDVIPPALLAGDPPDADYVEDPDPDDTQGALEDEEDIAAGEPDETDEQRSMRVRRAVHRGKHHPGKPGQRR